MDNTPQTTYTPAKREAYQRNKVAIAERESDRKRWLKYYADNKEKIAERRKAKREATEKPPVDEEKIKRYEELMAEAETLKKEVALYRLRNTLAEKKAHLLVAPQHVPAPADLPESPATPSPPA
jgi:vacuolar-type H+-ATPase subunit I/STV1